MTRRWRLGRTTTDVLLAVVVLAVQVGVAAGDLIGDGDRLDTLGWLLLVAGTSLLAVRRRWPGTVLTGIVAVSLPYHVNDYVHEAYVLAPLVALYTIASVGPRRRTLQIGGALGAVVLAVMLLSGGAGGLDVIGSVGWVPMTMALGEAVRLQRAYVAAIVDRAERAERTREEEAARRVAEERLRIARDLHDLLAHSITLIGVQATVAAHVLVEDPERLDRHALASSLETISETCRDARAELRTTLAVLRAGESEPNSPVPGIAGIVDVVAAIEATGLDVRLSVDAGATSVPPAVGAAAYRIVQEALTNVVRHAGATTAHVTIGEDGGSLHVVVIDDGRESTVDGGDGHGVLGMTERAGSIGGNLTAAPRHGGGFAVSAVLPTAGTVTTPQDDVTSAGSPR